MGDIADYYFENQYSGDCDEDEPSPVRCDRCGFVGYWLQVGDSWRIATDTGRIHSCNRVRAADFPIIREAT